MKRYLFAGEIFCEDDLSEEIDNYGGVLFDLYYYYLRRRGKVWEDRHYCLPGDSTIYYSPEELIESEYEALGIELIEGE